MSDLMQYYDPLSTIITITLSISGTVIIYCLIKWGQEMKERDREYEAKLSELIDRSNRIIDEAKEAIKERRLEKERLDKIYSKD
jgi:hypothetical protein